MAMAPHGGKKKDKKVEEFNKEDLYHDIKASRKKKLSSKDFEKHLMKLEIELVKLQ